MGTVSRPSKDRLVLDAGSKTLTPTHLATFHYGISQQYPDLRVVRLSEEHGIRSVNPGNPLRIGDRIEIYPAHICVVINMQRTVYLRNGNAIVGEMPIDAALASR